MSTKETSKIQIYPLFAAISSASLLLISISLLPIAQWAKTQNDCIDKTFRTDGTNNAGVPSKVWSCNGGGD
ncbi:hypothetical protein [Prochlorococcus sp. MIT 1307]|uniref:hypothetical protein n=1 Tax=Prochlorococcus sp. MIT 1307 TaxID=3096219 RepID=UPI002A7629F3|nr:hypothetical protein [Prochlorococcus sp. MIT 1307]